MNMDHVENDEDRYSFAEHSTVDFILGKAQRIAESFFYLYKEERRDPIENSYMIISECILGGIALELFMKGILKFQNHKVIFKNYRHNLKKLYNDLDDAAKDSILKKMIEIYTDKRDDHLQIDRIGLEILIENHKDIFIAMRYLFDEDYYAQIKKFSPFFLYALTVSFYNHVAEHCDDFKKQ